MKRKLISFILSIPIVFSVNLLNIHAEELSYTYTVIRNADTADVLPHLYELLN